MDLQLQLLEERTFSYSYWSRNGSLAMAPEGLYILFLETVSCFFKKYTSGKISATVYLTISWNRKGFAYGMELETILATV